MPEIVVIDRDEMLLELLSEILGSEGWTVRAFDGEDIPDLAVSPPDVIIIDPWLQTPHDGWPILHRLYSDPVLQAVRFVVWTTSPNELGWRETWLEVRGIPLLLKPCDLGELLAVLDSTSRPRRHA